MGRPYKSEIDKIPETYNWAIQVRCAELIHAIKLASFRPILAVGSGGSLSAAEFLVNWHQDFASGLGKSVTPQELISNIPSDGNVSVWFLSASGRNIDIRRAFKHALLLEPKQIVGLVGRPESLLKQISLSHKYSDFFEYDIPSGKDGFLATNSLVAFTVLLCKGYLDAFGSHDSLPSTLEKLTQFSFGAEDYYSSLEESCRRLWEKKTLHVIYSKEFKAAAIDIESKFIEAGLMSVHLADFRNFSHGRHHWFDKHRSDSAILALTAPADKDLSTKTLGLIPSDIPKTSIDFLSSNHLAKISSLITSLYLTDWVGDAKGIDPGRPGVPNFGRELYNLRAPSGFVNKMNTGEIIVERKYKTTHGIIKHGQKTHWEKAYNSFNKKLSAAKFGGLVLDYDGTVVDTRKRFEPPEKEIAEELNRLLAAGILLGFATGRGKSIRESLRNVINEKYWDKVLVGYYNGSQILSLDECTPDGTTPPEGVLSEVQEILGEHYEIASIAETTARKTQISIEPKQVVPENLLWELVHDELVKNKKLKVKVLRSSHSIDVLCSSTSKVSVVNKIKDMMDDLDVLTVGDRGKWPGNDNELLNHDYSLSVDEVSCSEQTCWNMCPAGVRGMQGALFYFKKMKIPVAKPYFKVRL